MTDKKTHFFTGPSDACYSNLSIKPGEELRVKLLLNHKYMSDMPTLTKAREPGKAVLIVYFVSFRT